MSEEEEEAKMNKYENDIKTGDPQLHPHTRKLIISKRQSYKKVMYKLSIM